VVVVVALVILGVRAMHTEGLSERMDRIQMQQKQTDDAVRKIEARP
jgi:hypothetical protein